MGEQIDAVTASWRTGKIIDVQQAMKELTVKVTARALFSGVDRRPDADRVPSLPYDRRRGHVPADREKPPVEVTPVQACLVRQRHGSGSPVRAPVLTRPWRDANFYRYKKSLGGPAPRREGTGAE
jgi:hypothetical protein